jgi:hypothetical protein
VSGIQLRKARPIHEIDPSHPRGTLFRLVHKRPDGCSLHINRLLILLRQALPSGWRDLSICQH